jgi:hypothetical protein
VEVAAGQRDELTGSIRRRVFFLVRCCCCFELVSSAGTPTTTFRARMQRRKKKLKQEGVARVFMGRRKRWCASFCRGKPQRGFCASVHIIQPIKRKQKAQTGAESRLKAHTLPVYVYIYIYIANAKCAHRRNSEEEQLQ